MRPKSNQGFVLLLTLVALMLVGVAVIVLARAGQDMCFGADEVHAQAQARDLTASALAWSRVNPQKLSTAGASGIRLTVEGYKDASAEVMLLKVTDRGTEIKITVHCHSGKNRINCTQTYHLSSDSWAALKPVQRTPWNSSTHSNNITNNVDPPPNTAGPQTGGCKTALSRRLLAQSPSGRYPLCL